MTILELKGIKKYFDGIRAVDNVSLSFKEGEISLIVGPNGAGKSTLFNIIAGLLASDEGEIIYKNKRINHWKQWKRAREGISLLFQEARIFKNLNLLQNILVAFQSQYDENPFAFLINFGKLRHMERENLDKAEQLLSLIGLKEKSHYKAEDLSFGEQKLLSIACLLAKGAEVLLLDELTAGLSPQMLSTILPLLKKLADDGKTIILIEHNLQAVLDIADIVHFMNEGRIVASGPTEELFQREEIQSFLAIDFSLSVLNIPPKGVD
jgi:ABC-type branched-subunit amino acid transport system ATPase component